MLDKNSYVEIQLSSLHINVYLLYCPFLFFFFFFFFFAFPSYISGVHHFWVRFLGVFLLPAFTCLGHERQDLLGPCNEMHVCTD